MRVGVNTGEVVVRSIRKDDLHTDYVLVGYSTGSPRGLMMKDLQETKVLIEELNH